MENSGTSLTANGRIVRLKWHQLRRAGDDPSFGMGNLIKGLRQGASVEIDVEILRDGRLVVLHGPALEKETTGTGRIDTVNPDAVLSARMVDAHGQAMDTGPILLSDMLDAVRKIAPELPPAGLETGPLLQLDIKARPELISENVSRAFARQIETISSFICLGATDYRQVQNLGRHCPQVLRGFDPEEVMRDARWARDFDMDWIVEAISSIAPDARIVYLPLELVVPGILAEKNLIAAIREHGYFVDCWRLEADDPDSAEMMQMIVEAGAHQITTNSPVALERLWLSEGRRWPLRRTLT